MTVKEFKEKYPLESMNSKQLLKRLYELDCKELLEDSEIKEKAKYILIESVTSYDVWNYYEEILSIYKAQEILELFDINFLQNNPHYLGYLFSSLASNDINGILEYVLENDKLFDMFFKEVEKLYSVFNKIKYEFLIKIITKIQNGNKLYSNSFISDLSEEYQKQLLKENFDDNILVWIISACNNDIKNTFFQYDEKAIELYSKFNINSLILNKIKFNEKIVSDKKFFELLKNESLIEFRKNIESVQEVNPSNILNIRINMYYEDMLNSYDSKTNMFEIYSDGQKDKSFLEKYKDKYILTDEIKNKIIFDDNEEELNQFLTKMTSQKISEIVIDGIFHDNYYNVMVNINEMLRYNDYLEDDKQKLDNNKKEFYLKIFNIDKMNNQEKIDLYYELKSKKIYQQFYFDLRKMKDTSYQEIISNLVNPLNNPELIDKEKTNKYGVNIYNYEEEKYSIIVRCSGPFNNKINKYRRNCYTLITDKDNTVFNESGFIYGYYNIDKQFILHTFESDSFSLDYGSGTKYVNRIMTIDQLANIQGYNEIQIVNKRNEDGTYTPLKPDFLVVFDEVKENHIEESKRLNIPIVIIKRKQISFREAIVNELAFDQIDDSYVSSNYQERARKSKR